MRLPGFRYEEIKREVVALYSRIGVGSVPVDPFAIAAKLGIRVVAYGDLGEAGRLACLRHSENGFKLLVEKGDGTLEQLIYYNEQMPERRVRFTILHEVGHIVLGHMQESDVSEAEAHFFAKYAIAPPALVKVIRPTSYMDIADAFELSGECALNSWNYYRKWLRVPGTKDYERDLVSMFTVVSGGGGELATTALRMKKGA